MNNIVLRNVVMLVIAMSFVILNGFVGRYIPPNGIFLTPLILMLTTLFTAFGTKYIKPVWISICSFIFVALNDISLKLYAGGAHDEEGLAWIHFFLFVGLVLTFILLSIAIIKNKQASLIHKFSAVILFSVLIAIYLYFFSNLGLGRYYPMENEEKEEILDYRTY